MDLNFHLFLEPSVDFVSFLFYFGVVLETGASFLKAALEDGQESKLLSRRRDAGAHCSTLSFHRRTVQLLTSSCCSQLHDRRLGCCCLEPWFRSMARRRGSEAANEVLVQYIARVVVAKKRC